MDRWTERVALVTGASMGVGEAVCRLLVQHGMKVVACARSMDKLTALASDLASEEKFYPIKCDLRNKEEIMNMFKEIKDRWGGVDVCINSAGLALDAPIIDGEIDQWENMWEVNVMALCICTRESVRSMRERGIDDGHVINLNSLSGHRVGKMHFYSATKYAVTSITEGIRWELRGIDSHIRVTNILSITAIDLKSVSPGLVKTNFAYTLLGEEGAKECYSTRQSLEADDIAAAIEYILSAPKHVQVSEIMIRPTEQVV